MTKFNPSLWDKIEMGQEYENQTGILRVNATNEVAAFVTQDGVEALAQVGREIRVQLQPGFQFRLEGEADTVAFAFAPLPVQMVLTAPVFTNADRMVHESGSVFEVTKAIRAFKLMQAEAMREARRERGKLEHAAKVLKGVQSEPPRTNNVPVDPVDPVDPVEPQLGGES